MRMSICAQSLASTPPAPDWIWTIAPPGSSSPDSMRLNSRSSSCFWIVATCPAASVAEASSLASSASSRSTSASDSARVCASHAPTTCSSCFLSRRMACAFFWSSQKFGRAATESSSSIFRRLWSTSKQPPELGHLVGELLQLRAHRAHIGTFDRHGDVLYPDATQGDQLGPVVGPAERHRVIPG